MLVDPRLLIEFAAIAEERSFTKAAERLRVAQPWLSSRLKKLEDIVGFQLLARSTRSVALTSRGADFLVAAQAVADAASAANALVFQLRRVDSMTLRVGVAPYTKVIQKRRELIDRFMGVRPDVALELDTGWTLALIDRLASGQIDLSFVMGETDPLVFDSVLLGRYGVSLTLSPDHALAHHRSISPSLLAGVVVHCFTRNLNPGIYDALYAPLIAAGAHLIDDPEMAEGPPDRMPHPEKVAAFFDFGDDAPSTSLVARVPVDHPATVPFSLVRPRNAVSRAGSDFWSIAQQAAA